MSYKYGDRVIDTTTDLSGVIVSTNRMVWKFSNYKWEGTKHYPYVKIRTSFSLTVKFDNNNVRFYTPEGSDRLWHSPVLIKEVSIDQ